MFDIGYSELLLIGIVALLVIGPKDLPRAMRMVGQWMARARGMARHFRSGIDTMVREAEIEEMNKQWAAHNAAIMAAHPGVPDDEAGLQDDEDFFDREERSPPAGAQPTDRPRPDRPAQPAPPVTGAVVPPAGQGELGGKA